MDERERETEKVEKREKGRRRGKHEVERGGWVDHGVRRKDDEV